MYFLGQLSFEGGPLFGICISLGNICSPSLVACLYHHWDNIIFNKWYNTTVFITIPFTKDFGCVYQLYLCILCISIVYAEAGCHWQICLLFLLSYETIMCIGKLYKKEHFLHFLYVLAKSWNFKCDLQKLIGRKYFNI